jgi:Holliday junction DNA helicase RuvA
MLAVHSPDALRKAVSNEDLNVLTMVPGIGKKGAQRIILELKDRLGAPGDFAGGGASAPRQAGRESWRDQVTSGLINLGWSVRDAEQAVAAVEAEHAEAAEASGADEPAPLDVPTALRAALRKLSRK